MQRSVRMIGVALLVALGLAVLSAADVAGAQEVNRTLDARARAAWDRLQDDEPAFAVAILAQAQGMVLPCPDGNGQCSLARLTSRIATHTGNEAPTPRYVIAQIDYESGGETRSVFLLFRRQHAAYLYRKLLMGIEGTDIRVAMGGTRAIISTLIVRPVEQDPGDYTRYEVDLTNGRVRHWSGPRPAN